MSPPKYEINRLSSEELTYELAIRGITDVGTVEVMRKTLRSLLKLEREGTPLDYPPYPFSFKDDSEAITSKITEIKALIAEFDGANDTVYNKILSKYAYALGRVNRCKATEAAEKPIRSKLVIEVINLKPDLESKVKLHERTVAGLTQGVLDLSILEQSDGEDRASDNSDREIPNLESTRIAKGSNVKSVPVSKWNLKFSGKMEDLSLSAFLERVEEMRISRHVSESDLYASACDLFVGDALIWYRGMRRKARDWSSLVCLLREQFQPRNYNDQLFKEIKRRTQHPSESMGIYVAYMNNLFERLQVNIPEATRLKILLDNIAPFYKIGLALKMKDITTVDTLLELGRDLEANRDSVEEYKPPPTRTRHTLERDLAYVDAPSTSRVNEVNANPIKCYNCNRQGHIARNCDQAPRRRCFKCNRPNVTVRTCPNCNMSGNATGRR